MVFKVFPRLEATVAAFLRALVGLVVALVNLHVRLRFLLRAELVEAVSAFGVVAHVQYAERGIAQVDFLDEQVVQIEGVLVFVQGLIEERVEGELVIILIFVRMLVHVREDLQAALLEVERHFKLFVTQLTDSLRLFGLEGKKSCFYTITESRSKSPERFLSSRRS